MAGYDPPTGTATQPLPMKVVAVAGIARTMANCPSTKTCVPGQTTAAAERGAVHHATPRTIHTVTMMGAKALALNRWETIMTSPEIQLDAELAESLVATRANVCQD